MYSVVIAVVGLVWSCMISLQKSQTDHDILNSTWRELPGSFIGGQCGSVGIELYNDTIYTFGGTCGAAIDIAKTYWADIDSFINDVNVDWYTYTWHDDNNKNISNGFRGLNSVRVNDLVYMTAPWPIWNTMLVYNLSSQEQVSLHDYAYQVGGNRSTNALYPDYQDSFYGACPVSNGTHVFAVGGCSDGDLDDPFSEITIFDTMFIYDIKNDEWNENSGPNIKTGGRCAHTCYYDSIRNLIWVYGGWKLLPAYFSPAAIHTTFEYFDLNTWEWSDVFSMADSRTIHQSFVVSLYSSINHHFKHYTFLVGGINAFNAIQNLITPNSENTLVNTTSITDPELIVTEYNDELKFYFNPEMPEEEGFMEFGARYINNGYSNGYDHNSEALMIDTIRVEFENDENGKFENVYQRYEYGLIVIGGNRGSDLSFISSLHYINVTYLEFIESFTITTTVGPTSTRNTLTESITTTTNMKASTTQGMTMFFTSFYFVFILFLFCLFHETKRQTRNFCFEIFVRMHTRIIGTNWSIFN